MGDVIDASLAMSESMKRHLNSIRKYHQKEDTEHSRYFKSLIGIVLQSRRLNMDIFDYVDVCVRCLKAHNMWPTPPVIQGPAILKRLEAYNPKIGSEPTKSRITIVEEALTPVLKDIAKGISADLAWRRNVRMLPEEILAAYPKALITRREQLTSRVKALARKKATMEKVRAAVEHVMGENIPGGTE